MLICLDAGHGGSDPGAIGFGLKEAEMTKKIVDICVKKLSFYDVRVITTSGSLENRVKTANDFKADYFISIHLNSSNKENVGEGFESYVKNHPPLMNEYNQKIIHNTIFNYLKQFKIVDRGMKMADFYVVKYTKMPSVLLELLFINNFNDNTLLKNEVFLDGLCEAIVSGIVSCFKLNKLFEKIDVQKNATTVMYNNKILDMDTFVFNGSTYVPVGRFSEYLGKKVSKQGNVINISNK